MRKEKSPLYKLLKRIVDYWDHMPIRIVTPVGRNESQFLSEIEDEEKIVQWIRDWMKDRKKND